MNEPSITRIPLVYPTNPGELEIYRTDLTARVAHNDDALQTVTYLKIPRKKRRGGHVHHNRIEKFYVIQGLLAASFRYVETGKVVNVKLSTGDVITVKPGWWHEFYAEKVSHLLELVPGKFDSTDVYWE